MVRRKLKELIALYSLEPSLRDIYVEGPTDRAFLTGILRKANLLRAMVREIDLVEIRAEDLLGLGLTEGARQRVIALALLLERAAIPELTNNVVCVADADTEAGGNPKFSAKLLLYTDVTSMPIYALAAEHLQGYFDIQLLGFPFTGGQVITMLTPVLRYAAATRTAFDSLGINCASVNASDDCEFVNGGIHFDHGRYLTRFINKAAAHHRRAAIDRKITSVTTTYGNNPQLWAHADDFQSLLHWLIIDRGHSRNTVRENLLTRTLLLGISPHDALEWPMIRALIGRFPPVQTSIS